MALPFLAQMVLTLAIGGLIGLERESALKSTVIGVRSFALLALSGLATAYLTSSYSTLIAPVGLAGAFLLGGLYYLFKVRKYKFLGVTTALDIPFSYGLGLLVGAGLAVESGILAIAMTFVLSEKDRIHRFVGKLSHQELTDILVLGILAFILAPLIPQEPFPLFGQPFDGQAAFRIVMFVQLINIVAHLAVKTYRKTGATVSAFFGSLVSSLAYLYFLLKSHGQHTYSQIRLQFTVGTTGALLRNIVILAFVNPVVLQASLAPLVAMLLSGVLLWGHFDDQAKPKSANNYTPEINLWTAVRFAIMFSAINIALGFLTTHSNLGFLAASFLAGAASSASAAASIALLAGAKTITMGDAAAGLTAAMIGELAAKVVIVSALSKPNLGRVLAPAALIGAIGLAALLI